MSSERTGLFFQGALVAGQIIQFPRVAYDRLATELDFYGQGSAPSGADAVFRITLAGIEQSGDCTLDNNLLVTENTISGGLIIPANVIPGIKVITPSFATDVVAWLTSTVESALDSGDPWLTPTVSDLRTTISDPEYEAFTSDILQLVNGDPIPTMLARMVNHIRAAVSRGGFQMGLEGTIPRELLEECLILTKFKLFQRVTATHGFADAMKDEAKRVEDFLKDDVAQGDVGISTPVDLAEQTMQGDSQVESTRTTRYFSRCRQDGLT